MFEMVKGGKIPHRKPLNKLRLKIKLKQNLDLAKDVIDLDNVPLNDLIINKGKTTSSKTSRKTKETKENIPWKPDRARGKVWIRWTF